MTDDDPCLLDSSSSVEGGVAAIDCSRRRGPHSLLRDNNLLSRIISF